MCVCCDVRCETMFHFDLFHFAPPPPLQRSGMRVRRLGGPCAGTRAFHSDRLRSLGHRYCPGSWVKGTGWSFGPSLGGMRSRGEYTAVSHLTGCSTTKRCGGPLGFLAPPAPWPYGMPYRCQVLLHAGATRSILPSPLMSHWNPPAVKSLRRESWDTGPQAMPFVFSLAPPPFPREMRFGPPLQ